MTPEDVRRATFNKPPLGKRGYAEEEVDAFLDKVETELVQLTLEIDRLHQDAAVTPPTPIATATQMLEIAQDTADRLTGEAEDRAKAIEHEAFTRAERLVADTQRRVDRELADARAQASKLLADAERRHMETVGRLTYDRASIETQITALRSQRTTLRDELTTYLQAHLAQLRDGTDEGEPCPADTSSSQTDTSHSNSPRTNGRSH